MILPLITETRAYNWSRASRSKESNILVLYISTFGNYSSQPILLNECLESFYNPSIQILILTELWILNLIRRPVAQKGSGCPIPGDTQGQAGWALSTRWSCGCPCALRGSWIRWPLSVPSNSKDFMILWPDFWGSSLSAKHNYYSHTNTNNSN